MAGIGRPKRLPLSHTYTCVHCGGSKTIEPRKAHQLLNRFCSAVCAGRHHQALGVEAARMPEAIERMRQTKIRQRPTRGYRKRNGRHEHRIVAEAMLGRALLPNEIVHHVNHNKADNRPENLEVMNRSEHCHAHDFGHHPGARRGNP